MAAAAGSSSSSSSAGAPLGSGRAPAPINHLLSYSCPRPCPAARRLQLLLCERRSRLRAVPAPGGKAQRRALPIETLQQIFDYAAPHDWRILLASSGADVLLWRVDGPTNADSGGYVFTPLPALECHAGAITGLAHDPLWGAGRFVSASKDKTAIVWCPCFESEVVRYEAEAVLAGHAGFVTHCVGAGRGRLGSAGKDGSVIVWNLTVLKNKTVAEAKALPLAALREHVFRVNASHSRTPFRRRVRTFVSIPLGDDNDGCLLGATYQSDRGCFCFDIWNPRSGCRVLSLESTNEPIMNVLPLGPGCFLTHGARKDPESLRCPAGPRITLWRDLSDARDGSAFQPCNLRLFDRLFDDADEYLAIVPLKLGEARFGCYRIPEDSTKQPRSLVAYAVPALQRGAAERPGTSAGGSDGLGGFLGGDRHAYITEDSAFARVTQSMYAPRDVAISISHQHSTLPACRARQLGTGKFLCVNLPRRSGDIFEIIDLYMESLDGGATLEPVLQFRGHLSGSGGVLCTHHAFGNLFVCGFKDEVVRVWWRDGEGNAGPGKAVGELQWCTELRRVGTDAQP
jgi:hypothetical protein